jgi:outer membrane protein
MNKLKSFFLAAFFLMSVSTFAQTANNATASVNVRIGYTNVDYVLSQMNESKQIEADLKAYSTQLETQLQGKFKEYESKAEAYRKGAATMTDVIKADKEKELMNLQNSIQEFQKNADASLQKKQQSLLEPALDKLQKAIDAVASENGYTYIFNSDAGYGSTPILLHGPQQDNVSELVLKKLGVDVTKQAAPAASRPTTTPNKPASTTTPAKKPTAPKK